MDEISLLEDLQANIAKRLTRLRQNQTEDERRGEDNNGWNVRRWAARLWKPPLNLRCGCSQCCCSTPYGAVDATLYHLKNGLKLLKDVKSIWARRCSIAEVQRRRILNSSLPICRLPNEILSLIFVPRPLHPLDPVKDYEVFRTAVGGVCFRFRNVLLGTPSCWSNIWVNTARASNMNISSESRLHAWIERSSNAPLRIWMTDVEDTNPTLSRRKRTMVNFLNRHSHRCQTLGLTVSEPMSAVELTSEGTWSTLQHLELQAKFSSEEDGHESLRNWPVFQNSLRALKIFDSAPNDEPSLVLPSLSTVFDPAALTHLDIDVPLDQLSHGSDFLKLCVHLEYLKWAYFGTPDDNDHLLSLSGHVFKHLKKANIEGEYPSTALGYAVAPHLEELHSRYMDAEREDLSFLNSPLSYPCLRLIDCVGATEVPVEGFRAFIGRNSAVECFNLCTEWGNAVEILGCLSEPLYSDLAPSERHDGVTGRGGLPWPNLKKLDLSPSEREAEVEPMIASIVDLLCCNEEVTVGFVRPVVWPIDWKDSIDALLREYPSRVIIEQCKWWTPPILTPPSPRTSEL